MWRWLQNQFENSVLYVPFIMAMGGALYFILWFEPKIPYVWIATIILGLVVFAVRRFKLICAIALFGFGFCWAMTFTQIINTPILRYTMRDAQINATVTNIDYTANKARVLLRVSCSDLGLDRNCTTIVRVSDVTEMNLPNIGDKINATVSLFRPTPADAPGTFDMARWSYFNGISATGYMTNYTVIQINEHNNVNTVRSYIHNVSQSMLVDGLVLGYKNAIPKNDRNIWTTAGIGHVWAISGFHMALVGGWLFAIFFAVFRLIPFITKRVPARKVAFIASAAGLFGYLLISGASVSTVRAFLMTLLAGCAFMLGRNALNLRNICLVFCIVFLCNPYSVMQPGFQLSFAAVFGLIWFWNNVNPPMPKNKILRIICAATITSLIATLFTAPFIITHFNNMPIYSLIGNLVLLPIFSVAIMPLVMLGTITACIGWHWPLSLANTIYIWTRYIAEYISDMPVANVSMPFVPNTAMCIIIIGFIALIFIRPIKSYVQYIIFTICVIIGITIIATYPKPVFMATSDHELVAFATADTITFNKAHASNHYFTFQTWKQLVGISPDTDNIRHKHNHGVYELNTDKFRLVYIQKFTALQDNIISLCNDDKTDYIVSYFNIKSLNCDNKILRDGFVVYANGRIKHTPTHRWWHRIRH